MLLNRAEPHWSATFPRPEIRQPEISARESLRVLLVEDDRDAAILVREYLNEAGGHRFEMEWIPDLLEAMFRLQHPGVDVVLLDLGLAGLDGYSTFRAIAGMTEGKIPIVILTADNRLRTRALILGSGAAGYLTKQEVSASELRGALHSATCLE